MALAIAAVVAYGFGPRFESRLLHPPSPRPAILYLHVWTFAAWIALFGVQAALIRSRLWQVHFALGSLGIALGLAMPWIGAATAIVMAAFDFRGGDANAPAFLVLPLFYMTAFGALVATAIALRRKNSQAHRRLMLIATCTLTVAAFARFPGLPIGTWDAFVDGLIALGMLRDRIVDGAVGRTYLVVLPLLAAGQLAANLVYFSNAAWWLAIAHALMRA